MQIDKFRTREDNATLVKIRGKASLLEQIKLA
jgi:hypothetical protein